MALQIAQILVQAKEDIYLERAKISKRVVEKGRKIAFRLYMTMELREVMEKLARDAWKIPLSELEFDYLGTIIQPHDTLLTLQCRDGDTIHAKNASYDIPIPTLKFDFKSLMTSTEGADFVFKVGQKDEKEDLKKEKNRNKRKSSESIDAEDSLDNDEVMSYQEIPVYRCLLRLRSEKFRGLFSSTMEENTMGFACIPHYSPKIFLYMLEYLYTDELPSLILNNKDDLWILLTLADEYLLTRLVRLCEVQLIKLIDLENVCSLYLMADSKTEDLKRACKQYFLDHCTELQTKCDFSELSQKCPDLFVALTSTSTPSTTMMVA